MLRCRYCEWILSSLGKSVWAVMWNAYLLGSVVGRGGALRVALRFQPCGDRVLSIARCHLGHVDPSVVVF